MDGLGHKKTKGQKTQEEIIQAALKLFGKHGFANTSMQMIADACDLSQGAVMQHFKSKLRLLEAVRSWVSQSNHQYVDGKLLPTDHGLAALRKHLLGNLEWALKNRAQVSIIYLTYESGIYDADQKNAAAGAARLGSERILRFLYSAQREKLLADDLNVELAAETIQEYLLGFVLRALNQPQIGASVPAQLEKKLIGFLNRYLQPLDKSAF
jgi:AcrR family transcriptional regulator